MNTETTVSTSTAVVRVCTECGVDFVISDDEQAFLRRVAEQQGNTWSLPKRCTPCRQARRAQQRAVQADTPDTWFDLDCVDCRQSFRFGPRDVAYFAARGFQWPRRCSSCRAQRRAERTA